MKTLARHIALLLLLVIGFPLVFQPVHILHHHHGDHFCDHSAERGAHFNHHHDSCPICDFEFTIFDLQDEPVRIKEKLPFALLAPSNPGAPFITYNGNAALLRAPPVEG